jgi:WD40 repeat protein
MAFSTVWFEAEASSGGEADQARDRLTDNGHGPLRTAQRPRRTGILAISGRFSPDGQILATAADDIRLWDVECRQFALPMTTTLELSHRVLTSDNASLARVLPNWLSEPSCPERGAASFST